MTYYSNFFTFLSLFHISLFFIFYFILMLPRLPTGGSGGQEGLRAGV
jgi:hypothetical protein